MSLGSRIKSLRLKTKLTQVEIAKQLDMGSSNFGHIENDRVVPSSSVLEKIASILDTNTDYLLGRTDDHRPSGIKEGMAFYGGGTDWTDEELEVAKAAIEAYRKMKAKKG